jgi:putative ABC transport system permease protein
LNPTGGKPREDTAMTMLWNAFMIALREIARNKTRAFLTVLGVIIGVAAVITMVTLGQSTTQAVKNQISNLGSNLLVLRPGMGFGPRSSSAGVPRFSEADAMAIAEQVPGVASVAPVGNTNLGTVYLQNARSSSITGTTPDYFQISKWTLAEGRLFNEADLRAGKRCA